MDLSLFCDTYIIAEYLHIKNTLRDIPRYRTGKHNGKPVIRMYTGNRENLTIRTFAPNSPSFTDVHSSLIHYNTLNHNLALYKDELTHRHITIPGDFKFIRDPSSYNNDAWNQMIPCSNPREISNEYYDDYGFHVRTRGEMMVGNVLKDLGLEAKYEPTLVLKGGRKKSPDYSFPIPVIDRCFFIEFMGMADDEGYIESNYGKIDEYMRSGILLNRDLIVITGTENWLPSQESIKRIIAAFINNAVLSTYSRK